MIHRPTFFGSSFCQNICIQGSKYDPSDGIIIQLKPKPLKSKSQIPTSRGLSITHKSSTLKLINTRQPIRQRQQKRLKSSQSLKPKKKLDLSHLNISKHNYQIDLTSLDNYKEQGSTNVIMSMNTSSFQSYPLNQKRIQSEYNQNKNDKYSLKPLNPALTNEQSLLQMRIHRLGGKKLHKQNNRPNQNQYQYPYYSRPLLISTPTSLPKKKTFLQLNVKKHKYFPKQKSFF